MKFECRDFGDVDLLGDERVRVYGGCWFWCCDGDVSFE